jgi:integrase
MPSTKLFSAVADDYLSQRSVSRNYSANVSRVASKAGAISAERINAFLKCRLELVAGTTVRSERTILLTLWRDAYERGLVDDAPRGVMRIKARRKPTKAWTIDELRVAIDKAGTYGHRKLRSGALLADFLRCWILLGYEAGSRFGDLWSLSASNVEGDVLRWTQSKTGDGITKILTPACLAACRKMLERSVDGRIIGWACRPRMAQRWMRVHLDSCGLEGTSKFLRRSGATHIEMSSPGQAKHHLGHRTPGLAESNYLDWGQIRQRSPQPPALVAT